MLEAFVRPVERRLSEATAQAVENFAGAGELFAMEVPLLSW